MLIPSPLRVFMLLVLIASSHVHTAETTRTFWEIPKNDGTYGRLFFDLNPKSKLTDGFEAITWREWAVQQALTPEKVGSLQVMKRPDNSGYVDYYRGASFPYDHPLLLASHKLDFSQSIETPTIESRWALKSSVLSIAAPVFTPQATLNHPVAIPHPIVNSLSNPGPHHIKHFSFPVHADNSLFKQKHPLLIRALPVSVRPQPLSLQTLMEHLAKAAPAERERLITLIREQNPNFIDSRNITENVLPTTPPTLIPTNSELPAAVGLIQGNSDVAQPVSSPSVNTHPLHQQAPPMVKSAALENAPRKATPPPFYPQGAWAKPPMITRTTEPSSNEPVEKKEPLKQVATTAAESVQKQPVAAQPALIETVSTKSKEKAQLEEEDLKRRAEQAARDRKHEEERKEREAAAAQAPRAEPAHITAKKHKKKNASHNDSASRDDSEEKLLAAAIKQNELMAAAEVTAAATASQKSFMVSFETCKETVLNFCKEKKEPDTAKAIIKDFFRKTPITHDQMVFIFQTISATSLAALYYDALNNLQEENALPVLSEGLFKHISEFMAHVISEQLAWVKSQEDTTSTQNAILYLEKIYALATKNSCSATASQHPTLSVIPAHNQFNAPLQTLFDMCEKLHKETSSKKLKTNIQKTLGRKLLKRKATNELPPLLQLLTTVQHATLFTAALRRFEKTTSYSLILEIINDHLKTVDASKRAVWLPYIDREKPIAFPSLDMDQTQVSFETICTLFQQEMIAYLSQAPLKEESFEAIECLVIKLFQKARSQKELFMAIEKTKSRLSTSFIPVEALLVFLMHSPHITLPKDQLITLLSEAQQQLELQIADIIHNQKHTLFPLLAHLQRFLPIVVQKLNDLSPQMHTATARLSDTTPYPVVTAIALDTFRQSLTQIIADKAVRHTLASGKKEEQTGIVKSILALVKAPEQAAYFMDVFRIHGTTLIQDARTLLENSDFELEPPIRELLITEFRKSL